ncbi:MAG: hypothetical protein HWE26_16505 [Alteromonadaceae bacterium]|nr:hypothetical protein [Alteromonadaceae bacterium]
METLISIAVLVSVPIFLALRHYDAYGTFEDSNIWGKSEKLALMIFMLYIAMVIVLGKSGIYTFYEPITAIRDHRFVYFFCAPGLGFGIAIFPRVAAEFSQLYLPMLKTGTLKYFAIFGWLIIVALTLVLVF